MAATVTFKEFIEREDNLGAGALIVARNTGNVLLGLRGKKTNNPGVWGNQGGHVDAGERVQDGLAREVREESGYTGPIDFIPFPSGKFKKNEFNFYNFIGIVPKEFKPKPMKGFEDETDKWGWFDFVDLPKPMHPIMLKQIGKVRSFVDSIIRQVDVHANGAIDREF